MATDFGTRKFHYMSLQRRLSVIERVVKKRALQADNCQVPANETILFVNNEE